MLAQTLQVSGDPVIAWLTGIAAGATVVMAAATLFLALQTRASVDVAGKVADAAKEEADATLALVSEARRDRELAVQPVLVIAAERPDERPDDGSLSPAVQLRNIGRGPAIRTRVFRWAEGALFWNSGPGFALAAGDTFPPPPPATATGAAALLLDRQRGAAGVSDIPGGPADGLLAFCLDQLGNALQFNLRTGDPPQVSRPSDTQRPAWATAPFTTYVSPPPEPPGPMIAYV